MDRKKHVMGALFGVCVGDALGLPVQFRDREMFKARPVGKMLGYGTFNKPPGTWSDDSSLTLCLAESLCEGFSLEDIGRRFVRWMDDGYWSADGRAFDIGGTTLRAVSRLRDGTSPLESGDTGDDCNGNGSLMRTLPAAFRPENEPLEEVLRKVHLVSAITHAHPVSRMACGIYVMVAINLLKGYSPQDALEKTKDDSSRLYAREPYERELPRFRRILEERIDLLPEEEIASGGYVIHTLEASLWCLLRGRSYRDTVLRAVNLGDDTDTTGAVAGGLAGLYHGFESIPREWIDCLARKDDILDLVDRFHESLDRV